VIQAAAAAAAATASPSQRFSAGSCSAAYPTPTETMSKSVRAQLHALLPLKHLRNRSMQANQLVMRNPTTAPAAAAALHRMCPQCSQCRHMYVLCCCRLTCVSAAAVSFLLKISTLGLRGPPR
jgi:hypothetical protein